MTHAGSYIATADGLVPNLDDKAMAARLGGAAPVAQDQPIIAGEPETTDGGSDNE